MNSQNFICGASRSLLGNVSPNLRALYLTEEKNSMILQFYYDKEPSEDEWELANLTDTEFLSYFPDVQTDFCVKNILYPMKIPNEGSCIYYRYEEGGRAISYGDSWNIKTFVSVDNGSLICGGSQSLLGHVTPNLRGVYIAKENKVLSLTFYYDKEPTKIECQLANLAGSQLVSYFPNIQTDLRVKNLPYPSRIKIPDEAICIYFRFEEYPNPK